MKMILSVGLKNVLFLFLFNYHTSAEYVKKCVDVPNKPAWWNNIKRLSPNSKFLYYLYSSTSNDCNVALSLCKEGGLELAKITSYADYKSIIAYHNAITPNNRPWFSWISGMDDDEEGDWKYHDYTPLTFSAFYGFDPVDDSFEGQRSADHMGLMLSKKDTLITNGTWTLAMIDIEDKEGIVPKTIHCQYKKSTSCYKNSDEETANKNEKDTTEYLGDTYFKKIYIGTKQKNHKNAKAFCEKENLKLLDLKLENVDESDELFKLMVNWVRKQGLPGASTSFVVDGENTDLFRGDNDVVKWEWVDNKLRDQTADFYQHAVYKKKGKRTFGRCLSVGTLFYDEARVFSLSRAICSIPRWVICYKKKARKPTTAKPKPTTKRPWTTEDPWTEDPWTEDPWTEDPWTEEPWTEDPWTEEPWTEDPWTEQPYTDNPWATTENPWSTTEEPWTERPDDKDLSQVDEVWTWEVIAV